MSQPPETNPMHTEGGAAVPAAPGLDVPTPHLGAQTVDPPSEGGSSSVPDSEHDPPLEGLGSKLRRGAAFASVALVFTQLISLSQTIVIARILTPLEIGTFTLGTLFANFLTTMADGGMRAALIQREREVEDAANTAFWVSLVTGTAMSLSALAAAPLLALYFDDRLVGLICAATCGTLLMHSLLNVPEALMQRRFNFKRRLVVDPTTASTFALVTVTLCLLGFGVWGMVIGLYASQTATLIACWTMARWRPGKGTFTFRIWREMAGYAAPLIISGVFDDAREIVQSALVGRRLDIAAAGQYRYGRRIGILPGQAIIQVASYVLFPAFARIAADITRFGHSMLRSLRMLWSATTPFAAVLIALGQPLIVVLLGEQWRPAGLFVAAMAGYGPGVAMGAIGIESIKGAGASKLINYLTGVSIVVGLGALILLLPFGLIGVGLAASIDGVVGGLLSLMLARRLAGVSVGDLAKVLLPPLVAAVAAGTVVGVLEHGLTHSDQRPIVLGLLFLALEGLLLLGIFVGLLYLMAPDAVRELRDGLLRRARRHGGDGGDAYDSGHDGDPDDPRPDDRRFYLDAPTEILPIFGLDSPTERVSSPFRRAPRPPSAPARGRAPERRPEAALPGAQEVAPPTTPTTPVGHAERAARFERSRLDAPTTALSPTRPPHDGASTPGTPNGSTNGSAPTTGPKPVNGSDEPTSGRPRRIVPMVRVSSRRRDDPTDDPEDGGRPTDPDD